MKSLKDFIIWIKLYFEGGEMMMIIFLANRIVLGKLTFAQVPTVLQDKVREELELNGVGFLADVE